MTLLTICSWAGCYERLQPGHGEVKPRRSVLSSKIDAASFRLNTSSSGEIVALRRSLRDVHSGMFALGWWKTVTLSRSLWWLLGQLLWDGCSKTVTLRRSLWNGCSRTAVLGWYMEDTYIWKTYTYGRHVLNRVYLVERTWWSVLGGVYLIECTRWSVFGGVHLVEYTQWSTLGGVYSVEYTRWIHSVEYTWWWSTLGSELQSVVKYTR